MEKIKLKVRGPYRCSEDEIDDGECRNCDRNFVLRQDARDHICPKPAPATDLVTGLRITRDDLYRRWVCEVFRSGYHNGATCNPRDPHDASWNCGYRNECHISLTDEQMKEWA
jgi:hypothetical protein